MPWIPLHDGEKLFVRTLGRGQPVVLIHGFGSNSSHWLPNVWPLRNQFRFILPDLRGFGRSHTVPIGDEDVFGLYARDINDVFRHFRLHNAALGGISTGAYACLSYNQHFGFERVSKYLNIEHSANSVNQNAETHGLFIDRQPIIFQRFARLNSMAHEAGINTPYWQLPEALRLELRGSMVQLIGRAINSRAARNTVHKLGPHTERLLAGRLFPVENWYAYIQVMQAFMRGNDTTPALAAVEKPITLMMGGQSRFFSEAAQLALTDSLPHAEVIKFPRAGHVPMAEQPLRFQRAFQRWLTTPGQPRNVAEAQVLTQALSKPQPPRRALA